MYEVQQYIGNSWENVWKVFEDVEGEKPQTFESVEDAQAELDEFFNDIHTAILNGDLGCDGDYYRDDFMIVEIPELLDIAA